MDGWTEIRNLISMANYRGKNSSGKKSQSSWNSLISRRWSKSELGLMQSSRIQVLPRPQTYYRQF